MSAILIDRPATRSSSSAAGLALTRRAWAGVGLIFIGYGLIAWIAATLVDGESWWVHGAWCIGGLVIAAAVVLRAIKRGFEVVITDHLVMLMIAFSLYFLFGASFMSFGPQEEVARALRYYNVDASGALRGNAVNGVGLGLALLVAALSPRRWFARTAGSAAKVVSRVPSSTALIALLIFGGSAFAYTLVFDFNFREGIVPGVIRTMAKFTVVGVFLAASYRGRHAIYFRLAAVILALILALSGLLLFNKTQILVSLGALVAGFALVYRVKVILPLGIVFLTAIYVLTSGLVAYGRNTLGTRDAAPFSERFEIAGEGMRARGEGDPLAQSSWWGRLSYVTAQAAGMDFYDLGMGAEDFRLIPWAFVPRLLAPDKPVMTQTPEVFHEKISGYEGSSTGQGIFSSGYYSGGWLGVFAAAGLAGWILAQTSAVATAILARRAVILLPFALYGVYMAFRIDGSFLTDYVGAFVFILYPAVFFWLLRAPRRPSGSTLSRS